MKGPMHPVLGEVRDEHDLDELERQRLRCHRILEPRPRRPPEEECRRQHRQHDRDLHQEMAHREVHQIGRPALTKDRLLGQARDHALERHEDERQDEQVQEKPVEPHGGRPTERADLGGRSAQQGARGGERHSGEAEDLPAAEDDAQRAHAEADHEHHVDQEADQVQGIERSRRRRGQPAREQQAQDTAVAESPARDREHAADPA